MSNEQSIIVIGCGNPLRGDDGVGWYAVDQLAETVTDGKIEFVKCRELTPEFSEKLRDVKYALFVDASVEAESGVVNEESVIPKDNFSSLESHKLGPAGLLAFSNALYGNIPKAMMLSVKGESFGYGEDISDTVRTVAEKLVFRAKEILNIWLNNSN
jgi:hydrogenase maturation protease